MTTNRHKLITCILPKGVAMSVVGTLETEKGITTANVSNARGMGKLTPRAYRALGDQTEKEILTVVVTENQADELFEFIYHEAQINRPHGGLMYMCRLQTSTPFLLPDVAEEG